MKSLLIAMFAVAFTLTLSACKSQHEEGVSSNMHAQWTDVMANTSDTTSAAKHVLGDEGLKDVTAQSTNVDGVASGVKADGTKVTVTVKKQSDTMSQVSVVVGTMGSPSLGAEIAKKIKMKAEGH